MSPSPPNREGARYSSHYAEAGSHSRSHTRPLAAIIAPLAALLICACLVATSNTARAAAASFHGPQAPRAAQWHVVPPATASNLRDVDMVSGSDGWAVGEEGIVLHYTGGVWQQVNLSTTNTLVDVFMLSATNGYILAWTDTGSAIYHYDGSTWNLEYSPDLSLSRIDASAPDNVWVVGLNVTLHWDGSSWNTVPIPVQRQLFAVQALSPNDVWAFGNLEPISGHGLILHYTNGAWTQAQSPAPQTLFDAFFLAPDDGWAVGTAVTETYVLRYDGASWRRAYTNTLAIYRIYMLSSTEGWAVGAQEGGPTISYYNGTDFQQIASPTTNPLNSISMASPTDGWIVGNYGTMLHYYDDTASPTPSATSTGTRTPTSTPSATATPTTCPITFTDVQPTDYFYAAVRYLYCHGVISGYADNTFRPGNDTTRGQLAKIVVLAEGWTLNTQGGPHFSDVPTNNAFYPFIETAYNRGVISGYSDGTYRWGANVTRGQLCKIVVLAEGWVLNTRGGPHFSDVPASDPFYAFVETAYNRTIISGYSDGTFRPANNATRGQISKIVYSAITQSSR